MMKPINRRSFFTKAVGMFGLLFIPLEGVHLETITIDAAGLEPHLEALMREILEGIQVRASEERVFFGAIKG